MNDERKDMAVQEELSPWLIRLLPLISTLVSGAAFWFAWLKVQDILDRPGFLLSDWSRLVLGTVMGLLCLAAAVLLLAGKSSGWSVLKGGLYMVPVMLASNLVIFIGHLIYNLFQGEGWPFLEKVFTEPRNIIIPAIIAALALLGALDKKKTN
jgi:hypothetical protein